MPNNRPDKTPYPYVLRKCIEVLSKLKKEKSAGGNFIKKKPVKKKKKKVKRYLCRNRYFLVNFAKYDDGDDDELLLWYGLPTKGV